MTLKLGVIGYSEGNGHPFSFSAIVNGYDDQAFARGGWDGIHTYLRARRPEDFGFGDVRVAACWMPDQDMARGLAAACKIPTVCDRPEDMIGQVDAVMVLRDDADSHRSMAEPFLSVGLPVFVDKPLCTTREDLDWFEPHLRSGQLMSCSGLRFAGEADGWRADPGQFGRIRLIRAAVVVDWPRYGVHMLECAMGALGVRPVAVQRHAVDHGSVAIRLEDDGLFLIDALGDVPRTFALDIFGDKGHSAIDILDNFTAFRRTLDAFVGQARTGRPAISPDDAMLTLRTLITGLEAMPGGPEIPVR